MFRKSAVEAEIARAYDWTPERAHRFVWYAFNGDSEAAANLAVACPLNQRASLVRSFYTAGVRRPAFREVLSCAWAQSGAYSNVLREAQTWPQFVRWLRYARSGLPSGLGRSAVIYRGSRCGDALATARGLSWTLVRKQAEWFSRNGAGSGPGILVAAQVRRRELIFYNNYWGEEEVVPMTIPPHGWRVI